MERDDELRMLALAAEVKDYELPAARLADLLDQAAADAETDNARQARRAAQVRAFIQAAGDGEAAS